MSTETTTGRVLLAWSGGKDAALALAVMREGAGPAVDGLLTTVSEQTGRSTMHGIRPALLHAQARALSLPIEFVFMPADASNEAYEAAMHETLSDARERGVDTVAFADIFLEDVRAYREELLGAADLTGHWPLWGRETGELIDELFGRGVHATIAVVAAESVSPGVLGWELSPDVVAGFPTAVDPCGEHGEFHTFVHDGPGFAHPLPVRPGRRVTRELDGAPYHYVDLLPRAGGK